MKSCRLFWAPALTLALMLGLLAGCGGGKESAASIRLARMEGRLTLTDAQEKSLTPAEDMGLYSGYTVSTLPVSYAWMSLDEARLAKLDDESTVDIEQKGRALTLDLREGSLYFDIEKPLDPDESLEIRSSDLIVGIRGTCGWVTAGEESVRVWLLEGRVECRAGADAPAAETVSAGQCAVYWLDTGEIELMPMGEGDIPAFVRDELGEDRLQELAAGWPDSGLGGPSVFDEKGDGNDAAVTGVAWADRCLSEIGLSDGRTGGLVGWSWVDFVGDGELTLVAVTREESVTEDGYIYLSVDTYRENGASSSIGHALAPGYEVRLAQKGRQRYLVLTTPWDDSGAFNCNIYGPVYLGGGAEWSLQAVEWLQADDGHNHYGIGEHNPDGSITYGNDKMIEHSRDEVFDVLESYGIEQVLASNEGGWLLCP